MTGSNQAQVGRHRRLDLIYQVGACGMAGKTLRPSQQDFGFKWIGRGCLVAIKANHKSSRVKEEEGPD